MYRTLRNLLLVLMVVVLSGRSAQATHSMGADLTYRSLGNNQYEITLTLYRDCLGIPVSPIDYVDVYNSCNLITGSVLVSLIPGTGQEITPLCPSALSTCNGGTFTGIQQYVYRGVFTLPSNCNSWTLEYDLCCRNAAITTIPNPLGANLNVYATINNTATQNDNSPVFSNLPVPFVCLGQQFCFSHGAYDADGDSIVYQLIPPRTLGGVSLNYLPGYSTQQPLTTSPAMSFNPATGDICFTPQQMEVTVMAVLVKEYRNGVLIGSVERDIQVTVINCANVIPQASGINGTTNFSINACANQQTCFTINSTDADASQTVTLDWDNSIPGATFSPGTGGRPTGTFCWTPSQADIGSSTCFTVTVTDNACPIYGIQTFTYCINVRGPLVSAGPDVNLACGGASTTALSATASNGTNGNYTYQWSNGATTAGTTVGPGTYIVAVTSGGCTSQDTVVVNPPPPPPVASFTSTSPCPGSPMNLTSTSTSPSPGSITQTQWSFGGGNTSTVSNPTYTFSNPGTYNVTLTVTNSNGCTSTITQPVTVQPLPVPVVTAAAVCSGESATVTASGGATYSWSPGGQTGSSVTVVPTQSQTYQVTVTSAAGCTATASVPVTVNPLPVVSVSSLPALCVGSANGSATAVPSGGTPPFSYAWSNGATGASASGLSAGAYSVTITDANGCTVTAATTVTSPPPIVPSPVATPAACNGTATGSVLASATGGIGPYSFSWSPGGAGASQGGLASGSYTVTVTDANGCTATASSTVSQPAPVTLAMTSTPAPCNGTATGTATAVASGGTPGYAYSWSGGATTQTATALTAGSYNVMVTDNNGCTTTASVSVAQAPPLNVTSSSTLATCGVANGSVSASAAGGTPSYQYSWAPGGYSGSSVTAVQSGNYTVTVTDANGCTMSGSVSVANVGGPTVAASVLSNVNCFGGSDGSASVQVTSGNGPFTITWPGGVTGPVAGNLSAGVIPVSVTDPNGCVGTDTVTIIQPPQLLPVTAAAPALCAATATGTASVNVSGGTPGYTYSWSPSGSANSSVNNIVAGNYTVTITDASGCTVTATATVGQPTPLTLSSSSLPANCAGAASGSATVQVSGGTPVYSYQWSNGATTVTAGNLTAGNYSVTVTDNNGCTTLSSVAVSEPVPLTLVTSTVPALCGSANGSASVLPSGGTPGYSYNWSPVGGTAASISGLPSGSYTVTVTDNNGCTQSAVAAVSNSGAPTATASLVQPVSCYGGSNGSVAAAATGGAAPYTYNWGGGITTATATNLSAGTYTVSVTDNYGCVSVATVSVPQPTPVLPVSVVSLVSCNNGTDGSVALTVSGGTAPYTYSWSNGAGTSQVATGLSAGNYTVTITDASGCTTTLAASVSQPSAVVPSATSVPVSCFGGSNGSATASATGGISPYTYSWSNGTASATATGLTAGSYPVTVTDANGCTATTAIQVIQPTAVNLSVASVPALCGFSNGSASVSAAGGIPGYTYNWSPVVGNSSSISGVSSGTYTATVTDANGCVSTAAVVVPNTGSPVLSAAPLHQVSCNGYSDGAAFVQITSGTPPFIISWAGGSANDTLSGLSAGTYPVTVTDFYGCISLATVQITEPDIVVPVISSTAVDCYGAATGSVSVQTTGGTPGYTYLWTPAIGTGSGASGLPAGQYAVTVTDANGCTGTSTVSVTQPPLLTLSGTTTPVTCSGGADGSATISPAGGSGTYTYSWTPSAGASNALVALAAGTYTVLVTDLAGCTAQSQLTVVEPPPIVLTLANATVSCFGATDGILQASVNGGAGAYQYSWSPGGLTGSAISNLGVGSYSVTVSDQNGCSTSNTASITSPDPLVLQVVGPPTLCIGQPGLLSASVSGGTQPFTYAWSNGGVDSTISVSPGSPTVYTVIVTDANGCTTAPQQIPVNVYPPLQVQTVPPPPICSGDSVNLMAAASGGNGGPYSYSWNNGSILSSASVIHPVNDSLFVVTVDDGCSTPALDTVLVDVNPVPVVDFTPRTIIGCTPVVVQFANNYSVPGGSVFQWDLDDNAFSGNSSPVHTYTTPGVYTVSLIVTTPEGCTDADTVLQAIQVYGNPVAGFDQSATTISELSPDVSFYDASVGAVAWFWDFGDGTTAQGVQQPVHHYSDTGTFVVRQVVVNEGGCLDTITGIVRVEPQSAIFIPNAFTPNGDGVNDGFIAIGYNILRYEMWIIDRWGREISHSVNFDRPWDGTYYHNGTPCQNDVYEYVIDAVDIKGTKTRYIGHVTLVR